MTNVSPWLAAIAMVVAVNPLRLHGRLAPTKVTAAGGAIAFGVYVGLGAIATGLLEAINVSGPTMRVAAGLILAAGAIRDLLIGPPAAEPALPGWKAALVPVAIPMLLRPHVGALALSIGASDGLAPLSLGTVLMVLMAIWTARQHGALSERVLGWLAAGAAVVAASIGVALAVDGVLSV